MESPSVTANQIETLRKLQAIDGELYRLRQEQRQKPLALERTKQLVAEQQAKAQAVEARLKTTQLQRKEQELELSQREANVKKLQVQLLQVKTNKEYTAIQHEIEQAKADCSLLEEEIIRLLDGIDQVAQEQRGEQEQLAQRQAQLRDDEQRVAQELQAIQQHVATLEQQRLTMTPLVKPETLSVYERVLANREGLALVPLANDSCGGCHMVQRPQAINEVYLKTALVMCESCSRILYLEEQNGERTAETPGVS